ncbi:MAG: sporulation protein YabP [Bacilli bacterium]|nr:sporulation protein YabP [Bacilli bacterium]MBQ8193676.1 sporulation protein YabP [Bacilli bacterium]
MDNSLDMSKHEVKIIDRGLIYLSGIDKIVSFDSEEFLMESVMGVILLKGENLEIVKLDTHDGVVSIKGNINSMTYDDGKKKEQESFLGKLFK